jgi:16S rRNA (adenine1518-N6/adenine1519-N6)-dimethyltransferase
VSPERLGQHFLEGPWADRLARAIAPSGDEAFIEIGPGRGALTVPLARAAAGIVAIEVDPRMVEALATRELPRLRVLHHDILSVPVETVGREVAAIGARRLRLAGNLPYNIAAPILFRILGWIDAGLPVEDAVVMVQREVADRLLARPGTKDYGVLAVLIGHRAAMTRLLDLPPGAFRPMPRVRSSVVRLQFHAPDPPVADRAAFSALVQAIFTRRRKTIANALLAHPPARRLSIPAILSQAGVDPRRRPETLSSDDLGRLSDLLTSA